MLEALSEGLGPEKATLKNRLGGDEREMEMKINFYPGVPGRSWPWGWWRTPTYPRSPCSFQMRLLACR